MSVPSGKHCRDTQSLKQVQYKDKHLSPTVHFQIRNLCFGERSVGLLESSLLQICTCKVEDNYEMRFTKMMIYPIGLLVVTFSSSHKHFNFILAVTAF